MSKANRQSVGLIGGGVMAQAKEGAGHKGDLLFFGGPFAGGGFFDQLGGVLVDGETASGGGEEGGTPGGPEDDSGAGVLDIDDQFDGEGGRAVLRDEFGQAVVDFDQAILRGAGSGIFNRARSKNGRFFGRALEDGVPGGAEGGVESEDRHERSVPSGVKLSREANGHGLTRKKGWLFWWNETDLAVFALECVLVGGELCPDE